MSTEQLYNAPLYRRRVAGSVKAMIFPVSSYFDEITLVGEGLPNYER